TTQVIDENPYLQRLPDQTESDQSLPENEAFDEVIGDEDGAPIEPEDERRKVRQRRRRLAQVGIAILLLMAIVFAIAIYRRSPTRVDYGDTAGEKGVLPPAPTINSNTQRDSRTDKAIEEAQRLTGRQTPTDYATASKPDAA